MAMIRFLLMFALGITLSRAGVDTGDPEFWLVLALVVAYGVARNREGREQGRR